MTRGTKRIIGVSFLLGVGAFLVTLLAAPVPPDPYAPRPLTPEELAQKEARDEASRIVGTHWRARQAVLVAQDWEELEAMASVAVAADPGYLWGRLDQMHAAARDPARAGEVREMARGLRPHALAALEPRRSRRTWQAHAALGWSSWFLGDDEGARCHWLDAAERTERSGGGPGGDAYNRAGYLSLAGEQDEAIEAWRDALRFGYQNIDYARVDYDYRDLWDDPRFEGAYREAIEDAGEGATEFPAR